MPRCQFCDRENPVGAEQCENCGAWIGPKREEAALEPEPTPASGVPEPDGLVGQILSLMKAGRKIEAIRLHRLQTGSDLKAAKQEVEALAAKYGITTPQTSGCAGVVLLVLLGFAASGVGAWLLG